MPDSVNNQYFKTLREAYERAHVEKNKINAQTSVGKGLGENESRFCCSR